MLDFEKLITKKEDQPASRQNQDSTVSSGNGLLDWAKNEILQAPDGEKHKTLIRVAYTLGGHVAGGTLLESEAFDICFSAITSRPIDSEQAARKTIEDGLREGRKKPLESGHQGYSQMPATSTRQPQTPMVTKANPAPEPEQNPEDRFKALQQYRFDSAKPVEKPDAIISIENHIISTRGNITTIAGQAKAGKSAVIAAILAGTLTVPGDVQPDLLGFTVKRNDARKAVLHIDGEQSFYDHHKGMSRLLNRTSRSKEPEWFYSYNFRVLDIPTRKADLLFLAGAISKKHGGLHLVVLDGGADFVLDTNDLKESNEVVRFFESLAIQFDCPVVIVLHFNPGSEKGRGHFGSQLERKSESVISVSKDKDSEVSTIEGKFLRNSGTIPNLQFIYDKEKGHHVFYGLKTKTNSAEARTTMLKEIAEAIFAESLACTHTELYKKIENAANVKERAAKKYIEEMKDNNLIFKDELEGKYLLVH